MIKYTKLSFLLFLFLSTQNVFAGNAATILETDWLETRPGSSGEILGAKVEHVQNTESSNTTILLISLPVSDIQDIDEIEVISKATEEPIKQTRPAEWIENYEKGNPGLRLFVNKKSGFEFRLRLIDNE